MKENLIPKEPALSKEIFLPSNVSFNMLLHRHLLAEDLGDSLQYKKRVKAADIIGIEMPGWTPEKLEDLNQISKGNYDVFKKTQELTKRYDPFVEFRLAQIDPLFASHSKILLADFKHSDSDFHKYMEIVQTGRLSLAEILKSTYEETLHELDQNLKRLADNEQLREDCILRNLGPRLQQIIEPNPKLKTKDTVDVFFMIGNTHRNIYNVLRNKYPNENLPSVSVEYGPNAYEDCPGLELKIKYNWGDSISDEERDRLLSEFLVENIVKSEIASSKEVQRHKLVKELTDVELKDVWSSLNYQIERADQTLPIWDKVKGILLAA